MKNFFMRVVMDVLRPAYTEPDATMTESASVPRVRGGSNLDASLGSEDPEVRMLLSFQRPPRLPRGGLPLPTPEG